MVGFVQLRQLYVLVAEGAVQRERIIHVRLGIVGTALAQQRFGPSRLRGAGSRVERRRIAKGSFRGGILFRIEQGLCEIVCGPKFLGLLIHRRLQMRDGRGRVLGA